ncbi:MAG: hypothetical protein KatS3mg056_2777 [Chloroflexus sp.]|nr:MAG: hypothetical protein KatS3mg056_2777 [Chloroflexus sp.]
MPGSYIGGSEHAVGSPPRYHLRLLLFSVRKCSFRTLQIAGYNHYGSTLCIDPQNSSAVLCPE